MREYVAQAGSAAFRGSMVPSERPIRNRPRSKTFWRAQNSEEHVNKIGASRKHAQNLTSVLFCLLAWILRGSHVDEPKKFMKNHQPFKSQRSSDPLTPRKTTDQPATTPKYATSLAPSNHPLKTMFTRHPPNNKGTLTPLTPEEAGYLMMTNITSANNRTTTTTTFEHALILAYQNHLQKTTSPEHFSNHKNISSLQNEAQQQIRLTNLNSPDNRISPRTSIAGRPQLEAAVEERLVKQKMITLRSSPGRSTGGTEDFPVPEALADPLGLEASVILGLNVEDGHEEPHQTPHEELNGPYRHDTALYDAQTHHGTLKTPSGRPTTLDVLKS
jgi:hypothetical protein